MADHHFEPPCFITIHVGGAPTGTSAPEGHRVGGIGMWASYLVAGTGLRKAHVAVRSNFYATAPHAP